MICPLCDSDFVRTGNRQKWCEPCRPAARRQEALRYQKENAHKIIPARRAYMAAKAAADPAGKRAQQNAWREKNRDALNAKRRTPEAREKANRRLREKHRTDPNHRVHVRMASAVHQALKGMKAGRKWETLVGYTLADLVAHLERQFSRGMTWANMGQWHIDHIRPKSGFDQTDPGQFRDCWGLSNLRPLWAPANQTKAARREHLL